MTSTEDNLQLLFKDGLVPHEHCIPSRLAHVKGNKNCEADMELSRADTLERPRINRKNNGEILREMQRKSDERVESFSKMRSQRNGIDYGF